MLAGEHNASVPSLPQSDGHLASHFGTITLIDVACMVSSLGICGLWIAYLKGFHIYLYPIGGPISPKMSLVALNLTKKM